MRLATEIAVKFFVGFLGAIVVMGLLVVGLPRALGQSVPVHEAKPGEIDRSYNYKPHGLPIQTEFAYIQEMPTTPHSCAKYNARRLAMVQMIAKEIAANPKVGYIYEGALRALSETWCEE